MLFTSSIASTAKNTIEIFQRTRHTTISCSATTLPATADIKAYAQNFQQTHPSKSSMLSQQPLTGAQQPTLEQEEQGSQQEEKTTGQVSADDAGGEVPLQSEHLYNADATQDAIDEDGRAETTLPIVTTEEQQAATTAPAAAFSLPQPIANTGPAAWKNPWYQIVQTAAHDPERDHCFVAKQHVLDTAREDPTNATHAYATRIFQARLEEEVLRHHTILSMILAIDGHQQDKSFDAIFDARLGRYNARLLRLRWHKIFKATNNFNAATTLPPSYDREVGDAPSYQRRVLYMTVHEWLMSNDVVYAGMIVDKAHKVRYQAERTVELAKELTSELRMEREELERAYREWHGSPPGYYDSLWTRRLSADE